MPDINCLKPTIYKPKFLEIVLCVAKQWYPGEVRRSSCFFVALVKEQSFLLSYYSLLLLLYYTRVFKVA